MIKIRFKDKVLSSMLLQTFRTHLPMFEATEDEDTVVVSNQNGDAVVFHIQADQITAKQPTFRYDALALRILIFLVGLPLCMISFFYFNVPQWLLQVVVPVVLILRYFYKVTHKKQYLRFLKKVDFFKMVTRVLASSYLGATEKAK